MLKNSVWQHEIHRQEDGWGEDHISIIMIMVKTTGGKYFFAT